MCGIYGAIGFNEKGLAAIAKYRRPLKLSSRKRGRDGNGEVEWAEGYIGTSRAHPLPEGEHIDLPCVHKELSMVFNGTLSNDAELIDSFALPYSDVDTETAIRVWDKLGYQACDHFVGGFAFGVYNKQTNTLTVAKNFKTLWYVSTPDYFVFASEKEFLMLTAMDPFDELYPRRFPENNVVVFSNKEKVETATINRQFWSSTPDLNDNKAVIVVSGGIDSVTAAHIAQKVHGKQIELVNFNYGQRSAEKEWGAVQLAASQLSCKSQCIDLTLLGKWGMSPLTDRSIELPLGKRSVESTLCWTPGRNMLMIAYSAAYAEAIGAKWLYYGNNMEEEATGYSDNDLEFIYLFNDLLKYGTLKGVQIKRALGRLMKKEILQVGDYLGVDYAKTWSCDEGFDLPCGVCGCCTTRQNAFRRAGLEDEQTYMEKLKDRYNWERSDPTEFDKLLNILNEDK